MKIGVRLFLSSMIFAIGISLVYWLTTHDITGVLFLGFMAAALVFLAGYITVSEREANLSSDRTDTRPSDWDGESMGVFSMESPWPIVAAAGVVVLVAGTAFLPGFSGFFAIMGFGILLLAIRGMVGEST